MSNSNYLFNGPENAEITFILAHGAGAPMDHRVMTSIAEGLGEAGLRVVRFEFPYMVERRLKGTKRPPNGQKVLLECWKSVIEEFRGNSTLVIGGKSMGGRMASMVADEEQVDGLLCLGYPFHPPGKPEKTRVNHLENLQTPTLIVQGTRDTMGKQEEVGGYSLSSQIALHWLEDGDHSFKPRKSSGRTEEQNLREGIQAAVEFCNQLNEGP